MEWSGIAPNHQATMARKGENPVLFFFLFHGASPYKHTPATPLPMHKLLKLPPRNELLVACQPPVLFTVGVPPPYMERNVQGVNCSTLNPIQFHGGSSSSNWSGVAWRCMA